MVKKMIDVIKILKKENKYNERIKTLVQELLRSNPFYVVFSFILGAVTSITEWI